MGEKRIEKLLNELADATVESVNCQVAESIKRQIPERLTQRKKGRGTINIIIDLRVNRLTAAAVIIIAIVLYASFMGGIDFTGGNIFEDFRVLMKSYLGRTVAEASSISAIKSKYEELVHQGKEVVYYGECIDIEDGNAVLLQWKLSDGKYRVIFADFRTKIVTADELIKLQAQMLQRKAE